MTLPQALFMGLLQGATELFPVSSLGHAVLLPTLLHWRFRQSDPSFLPFLVLLHLGTATALLVIYRREWLRIVRGFVAASVRGRLQTDDERLAMKLVVGTVPAGLIGLVLEKPLRAVFASPRSAAVFLVVNGALLLGAEMLRRRDERRLRSDSREEQEAAYAGLAQLSFRSAALVGLFQAVALLPGISRSGVTMAGGLLAGLRHQEAVHFSFLLATPIIAAAGVLEVPALVGSGAPLLEYTAGAVVAGAAAYVSARFLIRYFRVGRLEPYAYYCAGLGLLALLLIR